MSLTTEKIVVYLGAVPAKDQVVAEDLKSKGINLLRRAPHAVHAIGGPTTIQPNYSIYKSHLPLFMYSAMTHTKVAAHRTNFALLEHQGLPHLPINFPKLVVSWKVAVGEEVRDQMSKQGFRDTISKGKAAMIKERPTIDDVKFAVDRKVLQTTPCGEDCVNIFQFKKLLFILRLASTFLRTHQYPAFTSKDHESEFNKNFKDSSLEDQDMGDAKSRSADEDEPMDESLPSVSRDFLVNLPVPPADMPTHFDEHTYPKGAEGLIFRFEPALADYDRYTVPNTIKTHFFGALANNADDADEVFQDILGAWGACHNSKMGDILSHIYWGIDLAIRMQAQICVMLSHGTYDGFVLRGAGYQFTIGKVSYTAAPVEELERVVAIMDVHAHHLWSIMTKISFAADDDRLAAFRACRRMCKLKEYINALPLTGGQETRDKIISEAKHLNFPDDHLLEPTAAGIDIALSYIADASKNLENLPSMHHSLLFESSRLEIAWSAFGEVAPSFRVPGGKVMELGRSFSVTSEKIRKEQGPGARKAVTKIGAVMLPLEIAIQHLKLTIKEKNVLNPFGNMVVNAAQSHMNKLFEGDSCNLILSALRKVSQVTVEDDDGKKGKKRKGDDEEEVGAGKKKRRADDDL